MIDQDSPLDRIGAKERLEAKVVDTRTEPRIHGYSVHDDLARHYSFGEVILLTITGEPPTEAVGRAFEVVLTYMTPISIAEAPAHAARLGQAVNSSVSGIVSLAATALSEQARWLLDEHAGVLSWLADRSEDFPQQARADGPDQRRQVAALHAAVSDELGDLAIFSNDPALWPALLGVLYACGLREPGHILLAIVQARLSTAVAEATAVVPGQLKDYPINIPPIRYTDERDSEDKR